MISIKELIEQKKKESQPTEQVGDSTDNLSLEDKAALQATACSIISSSLAHGA